MTRICRCKSICSRILRSNSINTLFYCVTIWYPSICWSLSSNPISSLTLGYKPRLFMVFVTLLKIWKYVSQSVDLSEPIYFMHFNTHTLDNFHNKVHVTWDRYAKPNYITKPFYIPGQICSMICVFELGPYLVLDWVFTFLIGRPVFETRVVMGTLWYTKGHIPISSEPSLQSLSPSSIHEYGMHLPSQVFHHANKIW